MLSVSIPKSATRSALVETATKCLATASSLPSSLTTQSRAEVALVSVSSVPNVLDEMMNSVSSAFRSRVASAKSGVHVGHEPERDVARAVVAQRLIRHHRAQVGAADPDVDHVPDPLAGVALPDSGPDAQGEVHHPLEHLVHLADHVHAVHDEGGGPGHAQRDVQHRAVLGDVDVLAAEHS